MTHPLARIVGEPVLAETRTNLARSWERLPDALRTPRQMYGRQGNGCGATIGTMPRCDFACRGCYLGAEANDIPAASVDEIKAQMRLLRPTLGNAGNLQLTDGEVTLRPEGELVELIRYARSLGLIPMLMTHGESFRRRPGLLERLMVEGGLTEVSIHIDTTQRGRKGAAFKYAHREIDLNPLRDEFAQLVREAKRRTGLPLRCATTMTVTRDNLSGVGDIVRWVAANADAFRMISFQPIAQVGRTVQGLGGGVDADDLWTEVAHALAGSGGGPAPLGAGQKWLGHPACNRFVHGVVARKAGAPAVFHPLREEGNAVDARVVDGFLTRFGGISFRADGPRETLARVIGLAMAAPLFVASNLIPFALHWLRRLGDGRPLAAVLALATGRLRVDPLVLVSHHFMSREELDTTFGKERLAVCVFHVPVDGELVSMCEVNALGVRERFYERIRARLASAATASPRPKAPHPA
ncbi:MAG: hypothetical protein NVS1B4_20850 [Gemmatimonadaceae bacterium]